MAVESLGKTLILIGVVAIAIGAVLFLFGRVTWIGRLPGDIVIRRGNFTFYFPVVTMLLLSVVLTVLFNLIGRK